MDALTALLPGAAPGGQPPSDWSTFRASCAAFFALWALNQLLFRALGFNSGKAGDFGNAVSCGMSLFHGITTAVLSGREVLANPAAAMDGPNSAQQNFIMQLSMGYFLLDSLHVIAYRLDPLFVLHHAQTLTYMIWSSMLGRGATSVMWLMSSGEITSPLQNTWMVTKFAAERGWRRCAAAQAWLSPLFTIAFTIARVFVGPPIAFAVVAALRGSTALPLSARIVWSFMAVFGVFGSWIWVRKLLKGFFKAQAKKAPTRAAAKKRS